MNRWNKIALHVGANAVVEKIVIPLIDTAGGVAVAVKNPTSAHGIAGLKIPSSTRRAEVLNTVASGLGGDNTQGEGCQDNGHDCFNGPHLVAAGRFFLTIFVSSTFE